MMILLRSAARLAPRARASLATVARDARVSGLDDGSESTLGQDGQYTGSWDDTLHRPHGGSGRMVWDNGITFDGSWADGKFHGKGSKMYSRGGGFEGNWVAGRREGKGAHLFNGKFGYERWTGPFVADQPHGVGVMTFADGSEGSFEFKNGKPEPSSSEGGSSGVFEGRVRGVDDGSPSTVGVEGEYKGGVIDDDSSPSSSPPSSPSSSPSCIPHGFGVMSWDNGIQYKGMWKAGQYHGVGRKLYSKGGGYEGRWEQGKRQDLAGISFYSEGVSLGREGVLRWEGPFVNDQAHGVGQAYVAAEGMEGDERWEGDTAVKGPRIEFKEGLPVDFP